jgi:hypothetical protein
MSAAAASPIPDAAPVITATPSALTLVCAIAPSPSDTPEIVDRPSLFYIG